ncbi:KAP family P-loop NTPase fold protein [Ferrimonas sp.]|uniref:KAP family P-loop NTPase fold protein n=1 Tax=Ferrimonas sp. TaxID=2080861 RepID=UPI003A8E080A
MTEAVEVKQQSPQGQEVGKASQYFDWEMVDGKPRNFDNCALKRGGYAGFLVNYLNGEAEDGFVLNLNGGWGTGKTEFVRRLYTKLRNEDHPVVFIDAWTSDFAKDPLLVIGSELINQLSHCTERLNCPADLEKIKEWWAKGFQLAVKGVAMAGSVATTGTPAVGNRLADMFLGCVDIEPAKLADGLSGNYQEQKKAINKVRDHLEYLASYLDGLSGVNVPIYVIVDELDRCRPDYAIEVLETIKHFFAVPGVVFIVATNTEELVHSVKGTYGQGFNGDDYLKRFFDRRVTLSEPSIQDYLRSTKPEFPGLDNPQIVFGPKVSCQEDIYTLVELVSDAFSYRLRDVDQLVARTKACLRQVVEMSKNEPQVIHILGLMVALAEYDRGVESFNQRQVMNPVPPILSGIPSSFPKHGEVILLNAMKAFCQYKYDNQNRIQPFIIGPAQAISNSESFEQGERDLAHRHDSFMQIAWDIHHRRAEANYWYWDKIKNLVSHAVVIE